MAFPLVMVAPFCFIWICPAAAGPGPWSPGALRRRPVQGRSLAQPDEQGERHAGQREDLWVQGRSLISA